MVLKSRNVCFADLADRGGGTEGDSYYGTDGHALGTQCQVVFSAPNHRAAADFRSDISDWIRAFEMKYSRFIPGSMVSEVNRNAGVRPVAIDEELAGMLRLCDWFHWLTKGVFDPTLLPVEDLWDHRRANPLVPSGESIDEAMTYVGWRHVQWSDRQVFLPRTGMRLDIGGIGKEFAVDRVIEMAVLRGFRNILVDFGRDIRVLGSPPMGGAWQIGLEHAGDPSRCRMGIGLNRHAVATSGNYARYFDQDGERYGHIMDPRTGRPAATDCISASVIAPTCTEAGILATSCLVLGTEAGMTLLSGCPQAAAFVQTDRSTLRTTGFERHELQAAGAA